MSRRYAFCRFHSQIQLCERSLTSRIRKWPPDICSRRYYCDPIAHGRMTRLPRDVCSLQPRLGTSQAGIVRRGRLPPRRFCDMGLKARVAGGASHAGSSAGIGTRFIL
jgi:hypothetical protein